MHEDSQRDMAFFGLFNREKKETLDKGLEKSKESVLSKIGHAIAGKSTVDDDVLDDLEEALITSDVGVETTLRIIERVQERVKRDKYLGTAELRQILVEEIAGLLQENNTADVLDFSDPLPAKPYVIMVVGVNGVGKTTTVGKLAGRMKESGKKVLIASADTFRAAANEQLTGWAKRADVDIISSKEGADPASVVYDALCAAKARKTDVLICDTAGRLHNKKNLMEELKKMNRIVDKELIDAKRETWVVLDATTGQNALNQAKEFNEVASLSGIVLTKMDGTAKGGIAIAISNELNIPVKYIGVGEGIDDLQKFNPDEFIEALFTPEKE
ncbi:MAG: signal recognition particle-docking protein FtsY [Lachnospiraceae bacterium]|nr:signal recognition particle-docking protein FtsY [Lachnospiraceae bacterium]